MSVCVHVCVRCIFDNTSLFDDTCISADQNIFGFLFKLFSQKIFYLFQSQVFDLA